MYVALVVLIEVGAIYAAGRPVLSRLIGWGLTGGRTRRWPLWALLAPGVTLHESAHALVALALGGAIHRFVPFAPHREPDGVRFGYVTHSETAAGPVGGAMVGLAPLWLVPLLTYLIGVMVIPHAVLGDAPLDLLAAAAEHPAGWLWLMLSLSACIGLLPSPTDHRDLPAAMVVTAIFGALAAFAGVSFDLAVMRDPAIFFAQLLALPAGLAVTGRVFVAVRNA